MTAAAEAQVQHRVCLPGQWPQLSDQDREIVRALGRIGIPRVAGAVLIAYFRFSNGMPVTSWWLEHVTDARQPEVSLANAWLMKEGAIRIERQQMSSEGKGRPLKVYTMTEPVHQFVRRKIREYRLQSEKAVIDVEKTFPENPDAR